MINNDAFLDRTNYNEVWLRCVLVGFLAYLKNRINWVNEFDSGPVVVNVPFHASLSGSGKFILNSFKDDMSIDRVEMNTDQIPRGAVHLTDWSIKMEEFSNPNVYINKQIVDADEELKEIVAQVKVLPIKIGVHVDLIVDSEIDVMKAWQSMVTSLFMYKYFTYAYQRLPINANFFFPTDMTSPVVREKTFGDKSGQANLIIPIEFQIDTVLPIFDYENQQSANKQVEWVLQIWNEQQIALRRKDIDVPNSKLGPY